MILSFISFSNIIQNCYEFSNMFFFFFVSPLFYISNNFWIIVLSFIKETNLPLFHLKYPALVTFHPHRSPSPLKVASGFSSCSCALCLLEEPRETGQEPTLSQSPEICELPVRHSRIREVNCQTEETEADNHTSKKIKDFTSLKLFRMMIVVNVSNLDV